MFRRLCCFVMLLLSSFALAEQNTDAAMERRIDALLKQMTLEEKAGQLSGYVGDSPQTADVLTRGTAGALFNLLDADKTNAAQKTFLEHSRLKIPLLFGYDVIHGFRTIFPVPIGSASSFDPELIERSERVAAKEATAAGTKWTFAPMVDIARDPRWGRVVEGAGEDPYLGSMIAAARVRGLQGANTADPYSLLACLKHYVAYGAAEGGRDYNTADVSEQTLREVYLPPFHAGVDAGAATIMAAFEDLNGVPATANRHTLSDILLGEWGFSGLIVSDYASVKELIAHGVAHDEPEATEMAVTAGLDMSMADRLFEKYLPSLVRSGKVPASVLDDAVRRVLRAKLRAGLFDNPYTDEKRARTEILSAENMDASRRMAQESMVLLKNEKDLLPLDKDALKEGRTIALIGPLVDDQGDQLGPWAGDGEEENAVSPHTGIAAKLPGAKILVSRGVDFPSRRDEVAAAGTAGGAPAPTAATGVASAAVSGSASIDDAVRTARQAEVAILFLGEPALYSGEASSRSTLELPGDQEKLLEAVVATGKPVVLVLESGRPLNILWANDHVPAILQAWFPGSQAGNAIADLLFGDAAPSARLPISWPRTIGQIPVYYAHKNTGRPGPGDRWHTGYQFESREPLFPLGYGLTYTHFTYSNLRLLTPSVTTSGTLRVSAEIANDGQRAGTEVVQLYVRDRVGPTSRPVRELKGFSRVTLAAGEHKTVEFSVKANDRGSYGLGSYDPAMKWVVPEGTYDVWVAPSAVEGITGEFQVTK